MRLAAMLTLLASPALAWTPCEDLWFSRNQLFDRAGYCFASPLGQAVFGNAGCTGSEVTLEPGGAELVAYIRAMETQLGCAIDTSATALDIPHADLRLRLEVVVALSEFASGCLGWQGAAVPLLAGPRPGAAVLAQAVAGDDIVWEYEAMPWPEGWSFVTTYRQGVQTGLGWMPDTLDTAFCTGLAG